MSIYKGDTKVTGTGVQIDDTLSSTSTHAVTNSAITNALIDVGYSEWVKPQDWIDIENGAKENNIYFLVGHPADYSKYAKFSFRVEPEDRGTYDVYVDGQKIVSAANNWTTTTIDFQSLNLSTGFDVTHPEALRTHIVRVCASTIGQSITRIQTQSVSGQVNQGVLWAHFQLSNAIGIDSLFGSESSRRFSLLEALTAKDNKITYTVGSTGTTSGLYQSFAYCTALTQLPVLEAQNTTYGSGGYISFLNVPAKKIVIKNNKGKI